jgi:hypothetical protein
MKRFGNCIHGFFNWFDFSESPFTFTYDSSRSCSSICSGITLFLYIIAAILFLIGALIPLFKKENFTLQYYTMNLRKTDVLDFYDKSSTFAFGLDCRNENKTKEAEKLLELYFGYVSRSHETIYTVLNISQLHTCKPEDFRPELNDYYVSLGLKNYYCLNKDQTLNYTLQGIFTDDVFEYFYIGLSSKNNTEEHYEKIATLMMQNDCKLQYYYTDCIIDIDDFHNPITYFMDSMFLQLNPQLYIKKNVYYLNYHLYNDSSFIHDLDWFRLFKGGNDEPRIQVGLSRTYDYFEYKGLNRTKEIKNPDLYAAIYIRADNRKIEVKRIYQDINEFYGDNYILLDLYNLLCFLLGYVSNFFGRRSIKHKLFFYENNSKNKMSKNSIKKLFSGNKENIDNKSSITENTLVELKLDNINKDINNTNIYNDNNDNDLKNYDNSINNDNTRNNDNNINHKTNDINTPSDTQNPETKMTKKTKKKYELGCFHRFISCIFCCCKWTFSHGNNIIYSPDDFIDEKLDIIYYIKNMLLLELINQLEFENKQNFINFLITPIIESKRYHNGVGASEIANEEKSEDNVVDDIYKEASELEYNKVSEEIIDSMKNQQKRDIKLIKILNKKINDYNN